MVALRRKVYPKLRLRRKIAGRAVGYRINRRFYRKCRLVRAKHCFQVPQYVFYETVNALEDKYLALQVQSRRYFARFINWRPDLPFPDTFIHKRYAIILRKLRGARELLEVQYERLKVLHRRSVNR